MKLIKLGPFMAYTPKQSGENAVKIGAMFLRDGGGNDWYESQKQFSADTLKIAYNEKGIICAKSNDITALFPYELSVAEVDKAHVPPDFFSPQTDKVWAFDGESISEYESTAEETRQGWITNKARLLDEAEAAIRMLERTVKYDMATDEEKAKLEAWERYSVLLSRVDVEKPDWPAVPA